MADPETFWEHMADLGIPRTDKPPGINLAELFSFADGNTRLPWEEERYVRARKDGDRRSPRVRSSPAAESMEGSPGSVLGLPHGTDGRDGSGYGRRLRWGI